MSMSWKFLWNWLTVILYERAGTLLDTLTLAVAATSRETAILVSRFAVYCGTGFLWSSHQGLGDVLVIN